jgi:hypothetical protein
MSFNTKKNFFRPNVLKKIFYDFFVFFFVVSPDFFVLKDLFHKMQGCAREKSSGWAPKFQAPPCAPRAPPGIF